MYTSEEILAMEDLYDLSERDCILYKMTDDETGWLDFIRGRYSIADYIDRHTVGNIVTIWPYEMSTALNDDCDGFGKAVMLSDDTALQKIFFWLYAGTED